MQCRLNEKPFILITALPLRSPPRWSMLLQRRCGPRAGLPLSSNPDPEACQGMDLFRMATCSDLPVNALFAPFEIMYEVWHII